MPIERRSRLCECGMMRPWARRARTVLAKIREMVTSHWPDTLVLLALMATAVARSKSYRGVVIDDSFITFRHATNLVHGHGFSCDPVQHVEGTSSPLFALLTALPIAFNFEPYGFATWLATVAFAGCVLVTYLTVRACLAEPSARVLGLGASALVATSPILAFHSQTGLETLLYAFILAAACWQLLRSLAHAPPRVAWAVLMGVAALTRPEGIVLFALLLGVVFFARRGKLGSLRMLAYEVRAFAIVWLPWLVFRILYFGKWLPNSVLAKSGYRMGLQHAAVSGILDRLAHGEGSVMLAQFASEHVLEMVLLLGAVVLRKVRTPIVLAISLTLAYGAMVTWNGGDWMPNYRLLAPCVAPLAVGTAVGLRGFLFHDAQRGFRHLPSIILTALAFGAAISVAPRFPIRMPAIKDLPELREMGTRLMTVTRRDDLVISGMAGILPYYWGARTIDMYGLCDTHISGSGQPVPFGIGRFDPAYVVSKRPSFYAFEFPYFAVAFFELPEFAPYRNDYLMLQYPFGYLGSKTFSPPVLLVRKDRPERERLAQALGVRLVEVEPELRRTGFIGSR